MRVFEQELAPVAAALGRAGKGCTYLLGCGPCRRRGTDDARRPLLNGEHS